MMTVNPAASRRFSVLHFTTWLFILACLGIANFGWRASSAASPVPRQEADTQPPTVVLRSPVDGEVIRSGLIFTVVWQSTDNVRVDQQNISFSSDDGVTFDLSIAANLDGTVTQFEWRVPSTLRTTRGRVRVEAADGAGNRGNATSGRVSVTGSSDQLPPSVALISPDGADTSKSLFPNDGKSNGDPTRDQPIKIEWTAVDDTAIESFEISATLVPKTGQTTTFPIKVNDKPIPGDRRSFDWVPGPTIVSETVSLKIVVRDTSGNVGESITRTPFAIRNRPKINELDYYCSTVFIYGDNFTSRTLVNLNNRNLSPFKDLIELQPTPTPGDPRGSQVLRVQSNKERKKRGRFNDQVGFVNTVFVSDVGIVSSMVQKVGDGPKPPRIQFKTPAGNTLFPSGEEINISWEILNDDKCPVRQQELSFAQGNRGFDVECGLTDPNRRDLQIAVLDGSARSFTWKVPPFFPGFGRLKLKATGVEGTGEAIIGTGNPLNEPTTVTLTSPGKGDELVANTSDDPGINWNFVGGCDPTSFKITFLPTNRPGRGEITGIPGTARSFSDPLLKTDLPEPIRVTGFSSLVSSTPVLGRLIIQTIGGDEVSSVIEGVKLVRQKTDGGGDSLITDVQLSLLSSDPNCPGSNDTTNLAFGDKVSISWTVSRQIQPDRFTVKFNGQEIQPEGTQPIKQSPVTWNIPIDSAVVFDGVVTVEALDQNNMVIGSGQSSQSITLTRFAVNAKSSLSTINIGAKFKVSGCIRKRADDPIPTEQLAVRISFRSILSQSPTVLGDDVKLSQGSPPSFNVERIIPRDASPGAGVLIIEVVGGLNNAQTFGAAIIPIQIR